MAETDSGGSAATTKRNSRRLCWKGRGGSRNFLFGEGGGGATLVQKGILNFFCGKLPLTKTTTCFSISERRSKLSREKLFCEQR